MSIQSQINRISGNVTAALTAIGNKGVTVPSGSDSDDLATLIAAIPALTMAEATGTGAGGRAIGTTFGELDGHPQIFFLFSNDSSYHSLAKGEKCVAYVCYDGTDLRVCYVSRSSSTNSNAYMYYTATNFSWSYDDETNQISVSNTSSTDARFTSDVGYRLIYFY